MPFVKRLMCDQCYNDNIHEGMLICPKCGCESFSLHKAFETVTEERLVSGSWLFRTHGRKITTTISMIDDKPVNIVRVQELWGHDAFDNYP